MLRKYPLLFALTITLVTPISGQAALTLEYWSGAQDFTPYNPATPSIFNPQTLQGLRSWDFAGQSKLNSLSIPSGSQYIVKVVLRDRDTVGNGSGYTFSGDGTFENAYGLATFAFRFGYVPGVLEGHRDLTLGDGKAMTVTRWAGNSPGSTDTGENMNFSGLDYSASHFTVGGLSFNNINMNGVAPFQQANGDVIYPLANVLLTGGAQGTGVLTLSQPTTPLPNFGTVYDTPNGPVVLSYDNVLFGSGLGTLASLSFTVTPAPEPSSLLLAGLAVSSVGYYKRKRARRMNHEKRIS